MTIIQAILELSWCWLVIGGAFALVLTVAGISEAMRRVNEAVEHYDEGE